MAEKLYTREVTVTLPLLHDVFAGFLMLLIGLELMKTIVMYLEEHIIHVEVVLSVAMIGMGSIIIALAVGYFFFKKASLISHPHEIVAPRNEEKG